MVALSKKNFIPVALVAVVIAVLLPIAIWIGLDDEDREDTVKPNPTTDVAGAAGIESPPAGALVVRVVNFAFEPKEPTIKAGDKLSFQNVSSSQHRIILDDGKVDSGALDPGKVFTWTAQSGTYSLQCQVHPNQMNGQVTVR